MKNIKYFKTHYPNIQVHSTHVPKHLLIIMSVTQANEFESYMLSLRGTYELYWHIYKLDFISSQYYYLLQ